MTSTVHRIVRIESCEVLEQYVGIDSRFDEIVSHSRHFVVVDSPIVSTDKHFLSVSALSYLDCAFCPILSYWAELPATIDHRSWDDDSLVRPSWSELIDRLDKKRTHTQNNHKIAPNNYHHDKPNGSS